jgi:PEP-CTERM motif
MSITSLPFPLLSGRCSATRLTALVLLAAAFHSPSYASTNVSGSGLTGIANAGGTLQTPITLSDGTLPQGGMSVSGTGSTVGHLGNGDVTATAGITGMAEASYGLLRAQVGGSLFAISANPADDPFLQGLFSASFDDALVVSSNTLAIGTPVTLQMTMSFDAVITANAGALFDIRYELGNASGQVVDLERGSSTFSGLPPQVYGFTAPVTFSDTVGDTLHLSSALKVGIDQFFNGQSYQSGPLEGDYVFNQPSVDASHTSKVFLDAITPGVSLIAASGHDYGTVQAPPVSPVPEPTTAILMLLGLTAIVGMRRLSR